MLRRLMLVSAICGALFLPGKAHAIGLGIDVGGGTYLFNGLQLDAHLRVDQELFSWLKIGLRPGIAYTMYQPEGRISVPVDLMLRVQLAIFYLDAMGGLYWTPSAADPIAWHAAGGLGVAIWKFTVGVEIGYLAVGPTWSTPSANILGRVGFTFF